MSALVAAAAAGTPPTRLAASPGGGTPAERIALPAVDLRQVPSDPVEATLAELSALLRSGRLDPLELVAAYLERIEALDARLMAFNTVVADQARERARAMRGRPAAGPLHGIPLAIKDNYYTAGVPTTANSHVFADFLPDFDATAWARLQAAGAILLGKTQMGPLATSRATTPDGERTTVNAWAPHDAEVSPGGSSSGSATAVAARLAASSTGTQTGGSITSPALAQGLTGLKPTMGRVSLHGVIPLTYTRDHPGPIARDALDAALMLQAMAGPDPADPRTLGLPGVPDLVRAATPIERNGAGLRWATRIGFFPSDLSAETRDAQEQPDEPPETRLERSSARSAAVEGRRAMLATFEALGADVVEIEPPPDWEALTSSEMNNVRLPERTEPFLPYLRRDVRLFGTSLAPWINGLLLGGAEYLHGQRAKLALLRRILDDVFAGCDVLVQTSPIPFDIVGLPLVAFPVGFRDTPSGPRPVGAMLGGQPYAEDRLLSLAAAYQAVTDWHRRRPSDPQPGPDARGPSRGRETLESVMELGQ